MTTEPILYKNGLNDSLGFLLGVAYRKMSNFLSQRLKEYDITPEQWSVLYRIYERDGLIQKDIAARAGKDKPTTTRILDSLEAKQFIRKQVGQGDRRSFHIYMTDKGRTLIEETISIERQTIRDAAAGLSQEQYDQLITFLHGIIDNLTLTSESE
ncbi:MarR family winged helix-turn-helix transcriptional regulator [Paenibacillus chitinolyticus]|uniref:MarR family winged helix-turn-helix transcriptional regulator n=1 Tax=Paenibacillus chitinolyticus TaxID=79263 RepID=UPI002DB78D36|nr:MarR family transcriptional regulator [Paenibacillus chitinolyticus]MEC0248721.1 MarR family transcriptional regulator [Paenibacillus chitinolyticus]